MTKHIHIHLHRASAKARDAGFDEAKHKRDHGKFSTTSGPNGATHVHHEGKHIGTVTKEDGFHSASYHHNGHKLEQLSGSKAEAIKDVQSMHEKHGGTKPAAAPGPRPLAPAPARSKEFSSRGAFGGSKPAAPANVHKDNEAFKAEKLAKLPTPVTVKQLNVKTDPKHNPSPYAHELSNKAQASNTEIDHRAAAEAHQTAGDHHDKQGDDVTAAKHYKAQGHHERQAEQLRPFGRK